MEGPRKSKSIVLSCCANFHCLFGSIDKNIDKVPQYTLAKTKNR